MKRQKYETLTTPYFEKADKILPWNVYPRPTMKRESFLNLNGEWDLQISDTEKIPEIFEEKITVPYPIGSLLSGVERQIDEGRVAFYRRTFKIPDGFIKDKNYKLGVLTPHIVFNYLDYLLWKRDYNDYLGKKIAKQKYSDFEFEFRNSVEHWYPQHPSDGSFDQWEEKDRFGNLCIISRNVNSKFSNLSPASKMKTYENLVNKGSIKLRIMGEIISRSNNSNSNENWRNNDCEEHENEMINTLEKNIKSLLQISTTA